MKLFYRKNLKPKNYLKNTRTWNDSYDQGLTVHIGKIAGQFKATNRFNASPRRVPVSLLTNIEETSLKFINKLKMPEIDKAILTKK